MAIGDKTTFNYTGAVQTWTVPAGCNRVKIEAFGGSGGIYWNTAYYGNNFAIAGKGGYAYGEMNVSPGQVLNIYVGGKGNDTASYNAGLGGWNGGGNGGNAASGSSNYTGGGGGGGASDVRIGGTGLGNRVIVAGGGGGICTNTNNATSQAQNAGNGGGLVGQDAAGGNTAPAGGGTQIAGGAGGAYSGYAGNPGSSGQGGSGGGGNIASAGGGGGGGYYGGGGGGASYGGAGGSSYYGTLEYAGTTPGVQTGHGQVVITWAGVPTKITTPSANVGNKDSKDNIVTYSLNQGEYGISQIKETVDGTVTRTLTNPTQYTQSPVLTDDQWDAISYGNGIPILVDVTDAAGHTSSSIFTFNKRLNPKDGIKGVQKSLDDMSAYVDSIKTQLYNFAVSKKVAVNKTDLFDDMFAALNAGVVGVLPVDFKGTPLTKMLTLTISSSNSAKHNMQRFTLDNKYYIYNSNTFDWIKYDILNNAYTNLGHHSDWTSAPTAMCMSDDGSIIYVNWSNKIYVYQNGVWTLLTSAYTPNNNIGCNPDGSELYFYDDAAYVLHKYTLSTNTITTLHTYSAASGNVPNVISWVDDNSIWMSLNGSTAMMKKISLVDGTEKISFNFPYSFTRNWIGFRDSTLNSYGILVCGNGSGLLDYSCRLNKDGTNTGLISANYGYNASSGTLDGKYQIMCNTQSTLYFYQAQISNSAYAQIFPVNSGGYTSPYAASSDNRWGNAATLDSWAIYQ